MPRHVLDVLTDLSRGSAYEAVIADGVAPWWSRLIHAPEDVFAVTSVLLQESGAYRLAVSPPEPWPPEDWQRKTEEVAEGWWRWIWELTDLVPGDVLRRGGAFAEHAFVPIGKIDQCWPLARALLELHAMADATCGGFGVPPSRRPVSDPAWESFRARANVYLGRHGTLSRFLPERIRILPKMRTPQAGISLRSLSGNLAAVRSGDVDVSWSFAQTVEEQKSSLNLLLLPVPLAVRPTDFTSAPTPLPNLDRKFGFFRFQPRALDEAYLDAMLQAAAERAGGVDGVVLPELAVTREEYLQVQAGCERVFGARGRPIPFVLAGVRAERSNMALFSVHTGLEGVWRAYPQAKHHRWCLDRSQITHYGLGAALHPSVRWWEDIAIERRQLNVFVANSWLSICPLICEDLARQDPIAQVIRALGPTLVLALLLDGPQLVERWPARYASVLADDPGSSVLTFTPLGMALRSVPPGKAPRRVVGLWKDAKTGVRELALDDDAGALLVTLCNEWAEEWLADGRSDGGCAAELYLGHVEQLTWPKRPS